MKTPRGIVPGYNAQAVVSPAHGDGEGGGMLVTAATVVDAPDDHEQLLPMLEQAQQTTGTAALTLADAGYHSGRALEACERREQRVVMPETRQRLLTRPYDKHQFRYEQDSDRYICPAGQPLAFQWNSWQRGGAGPGVMYAARVRRSGNAPRVRGDAW